MITQQERTQLIKETNEAYARLKSDPIAWKEYQDEIKSMEGTLMDGLEGYSYEGI